jgi:hypothetical protein
MAPYPVHLGTASVIGAAYGAAGIWLFNLDWGPAFLAAGLTAIGGVLPDLDSDSGIPVRELFSIGAAGLPFLIFDRLRSFPFSPEQTLVILGALYLFIRYTLSAWFKRFTVHRGIFHSLPAMLVAGLAVYLAYDNPNPKLRAYLAGGTMIGFLSHLVLDEMYSVDFLGFKVRLNKYAGSALKLYSPSWVATFACYLLLGVLVFLCLAQGGTQ